MSIVNYYEVNINKKKTLQKDMSWSRLPPFFFFSFYKWNQSELLLSSVRQKELINVFAHHECECTCWRYSKKKTTKNSQTNKI